MELQFIAEQEAFRKEIQDFLKQELPADWDGGEQDSPDKIEFSKGMSTKLAQKGWLTMNWPKEYGGQDRPKLEQMIYREEIAYNGAPGSDLGSGAVSWVGPTLILYGTEEQKQEHLPPITRAERYWCTFYSEPGTGSDLAGLQTSAVADGDDFVVNGSKIWTSQAHYADWGWLAARTDPDAPKHRGISLMLVDMKTPGITVRPVIKMTGAHEFNQVFFDNVRVPKKNLVGELNRGWYTLAVALDFERSGVAYSARGQRDLETLIEYTRETKDDGGKPLSQDPVIRNKLVDMAVEIQVSRWLSYRVSWMQGEGLLPNYEASMSKVFGSELQQRLGNTGMEILGMYGQLAKGSKWAHLEGRVARSYLNAFSATIGAGTSEIQRNIIARRGLGLPRD
jgi:alkylation response protein AidB-like acyl-CoA dehydrogenase